MAGEKSNNPLSGVANPGDPILIKKPTGLGGTVTPGGISAKAKAALDAKTVSGKGIFPVEPVLEGGLRQVNPLYTTEDVVGSINVNTYMLNLAPKTRADIQRKIFNLGLYPQGYTPTFGTYSPTEDVKVITKLAIVGEQNNIADPFAVIDFANKNASIKNLLTTGGYTTTGGVVTTTSAAELASKLTANWMDMFNEKPSKSELASYTKSINALEKNQKGNVGTQQREDVLVNLAAVKANSLVKASKTGDIKAVDALDTGTLGKTIRTIKNAYEDNGVPYDVNRVYAQAVKAMRSPQALDTVITGIQINAGTQWTPWAPLIKDGHLVKDLVNPYITIKSNIRGIPTSSIKTSDMTDVIKPDGTLKTYAEYKSEQYKTPEFLNGAVHKANILSDTRTMLTDLGVGV